MDRETDNLSDDGTDDAQQLTSDSLDDLDFDDPDEDSEEVLDADKIDDEETEDSEEVGDDDDDEPEGLDVTDNPDDKDPDDQAEPLKDDVLVTLNSGDQIPLSELKDGYLRQSDYTRKSQENANKARALASQNESIENTINTFVDFLYKSLPPEPDAALSVSNPTEFVQQKAQHDAALSQIQTLLDLAQEPKEIASQIDQQARQELLERENAALLTAFPSTSTPKGREAFFNAAQSAALEVGFTSEEIKQVTDHRIFAVAYWAKRGLDAQRAQKVAKKKVKDAPPVTPRKAGTGANKEKANKNRKAMQRLKQTGSLEDAMMVDFD